MLEPLIDTVEEKAIVTDHCMMLSVDLYNVRKEELNFVTPFRLKSLHEDRVHALVVYFDMWFTSCHKIVHFSTGPHAKYTHWKQTVFYLDEVLHVKVDDEIVGTLACKQNKKNPRDLDIKIHYKFQGEHNDCDRRQVFYIR